MVKSSLSPHNPVRGSLTLPRVLYGFLLSKDIALFVCCVLRSAHLLPLVGHGDTNGFKRMDASPTQGYRNVGDKSSMYGRALENSWASFSPDTRKTCKTSRALGSQSAGTMRPRRKCL